MIVYYGCRDSNPAVSRNLREAAKYRNIAPERLVFSLFTKEYSDYLARYRVADLFLDTLPFNAGGTASDALWARLPLLTCSGQTYVARMAGSLLKAIGLPELITTTLEAYEQMAIDLATHPEKLAAIKHTLAKNRLTTPLFDTKLFSPNTLKQHTRLCTSGIRLVCHQIILLSRTEIRRLGLLLMLWTAPPPARACHESGCC